MKNVIKPLAKSVFIPLGLTTPALAVDAGIHKKILGSSHNTVTLIISNDEIEGIITLIKSLEDSDLLLKAVCDTIQNEAKEQKGQFISRLLVTLGACLLATMLTDKEFIKAGYTSEGFKKGKRLVRASYKSRGSLIKDF